MGHFDLLAKYFIGVFRTIIWFVLLVALLFVAYCLVRLLGLAFHHANQAWFTGNEGIGLIVAAALILLIGWVAPWFHRLRRRRYPRYPGQLESRGRWEADQNESDE